MDVLRWIPQFACEDFRMVHVEGPFSHADVEITVVDLIQSMGIAFFESVHSVRLWTRFIPELHTYFVCRFTVFRQCERDLTTFPLRMVSCASDYRLVASTVAPAYDLAQTEERICFRSRLDRDLCRFQHWQVGNNPRVLSVVEDSMTTDETLLQHFFPGTPLVSNVDCSVHIDHWTNVSFRDQLLNDRWKRRIQGDVSELVLYEDPDERCT